MSFSVPLNMPSLNGKRDTGLRINEHGVHDTLSFGFCKIKENVATVHPLELSEKNFLQNEEVARMSALRNLQGLHAPLKFAAELRATRSVGRLPFLESSRLSTSALRGDDDTIDFSDILGLPEFDERQLHPHVVMENRYRI